MNTFAFWKDWNKSDSRVYQALLLLFAATLLLLGYAFFSGNADVLALTTRDEATAVNLVLDKHQHNVHDFKVEADQYLISQQFINAPLHLNTLWMYVYLGLLFTAVIIILSVITYLDIWYYLFAMTVFLFYLGFMQTELLSVFGLENKKFLAGLIIAYLTPSYLLRSYSNTNLLQRISIFTLISIAFLLCVYSGSTQISQPLLFLPNFGIAFPIALTVLFLIIIGFDTIKGFLSLVSNGRAEQKQGALGNFLLISGLYILSVLLTLLKKKLYIDWDIVYINPFIFYVIAAVYGIWAYKKRSILFREILPFRPLGALFYISLAIISTATMAYAKLMANDPLVESLEYAILYTQLCLSIVFVIYILFNFYNFFATNLNIHEVVYKPNSMPFFMVRGIAVVGMIGLFFFSSKYPLHLAKAGYYNSTGDVYYLEGDLVMAKQHYLNGYNSEFQNIRSSYSLATIYEAEEKQTETKTFYESSLVKHKQVISFIGLSNVYYNNEQMFNALFTLKDGLKYFPESAALHTNIAKIYNKLNIADSALFSFERAYLLDQNDITLSNLVYARIKFNNTENNEAILAQDLIEGQSIQLQTNLTVLKSLNGQKTDKKLLAQIHNSKEIGNNEFYFIHNYTINHLGDRNPAIDSLIQQMQKDSMLYTIHENVRWLKALHAYYSGRKSEGIELLINLNLSTANPVYSRIIACWMLHEGAAEKAAYYYEQSMRSGEQSDALNMVMAMMIQHAPYANFQNTIDSLCTSKNTAIQKEAVDHRAAYTLKTYSPTSVNSDKSRFLFLSYNYAQLSIDVIKGIITEMKQADYIVLSSALLMNKYLNEGEKEAANEIWKGLSKYTEISPYSMSSAHLAYLDMLVAFQDWGTLRTELEDIFLLPQDAGLKSYYQALCAQNKGERTNASNLYKEAARNNPLDARVCTAAAAYLNQAGDPQDAYDLLQNAITYNNENALLLFAYCKQAIVLNLPSYAEYVLPTLEEVGTAAQVAEVKELLRNSSSTE